MDSTKEISGKNDADDSKFNNKNDLDLVFDKYREIINKLNEKKKLKPISNNSEENNKEKYDIESLCFICYTRTIDTVISPCKHGKFFKLNQFF